MMRVPFEYMEEHNLTRSSQLQSHIGSLLDGACHSRERINAGVYVVFGVMYPDYKNSVVHAVVKLYVHEQFRTEPDTIDELLALVALEVHRDG